jgi:glutaredoxin 3
MMTEVTIYTRAMCGYCASAKALLERKGVAYRELDATFDPRLRGEMIDRSGRYTFPQIFIGDIHVGGSDELHALERQGRLDPLLATGAQA